MSRLALGVLSVVMMLGAALASAVEPGEMLDDPTLEARARDLSKGLRCLVCRNENIDDSDAALARDLRILLRARILAGDTDAQAVDFIVERYGEYVLLRPKADGSALVLWLAGPAALLLGGGAGADHAAQARARAIARSVERRGRITLGRGSDQRPVTCRHGCLGGGSSLGSCHSRGRQWHKRI